MSRYRTTALAAAAALVLLHAGILVFHYGSQLASVWGDWIDTAAPLVAFVICWLASRQAGPFGKRVWRLAALSSLLATVGQGLYTQYYDYLHAPLGTLWPSDVLVFFWVVPIVMTLFLHPRDPGGHGWLRVSDFAQVCTLALAVELSEIYVPSRWQSAGRAMQIHAFHAGIFFYGLIATSFLVRGLLTANRTERRYFLRMGGFLLVYSVVLNGTLYYQASGHYQQGEWPDIIWTLSYGLLIVIAGTWSDREEDVPLESRSGTLQRLAQFSPALIPAIVFPMALSIAQEQFWWAAVLVIVSFAAATGRMFVVQDQLLISSRELKKNLALLRGITEGTTDAVFVKDLDGRYLMINSAGAALIGHRVEDVLGKDDSKLLSPDTAPAVMELDRKVIASGVTQTYEERAAGADGISRLYLSTKGPYRDANGEIAGLLGICRDITARKRAEEEIRQSQQKLRIHFEHTPLAVVEWDLEFRVTAWNPSAERIFGYTRQEALGQHASFIVPAHNRRQLDEVWQRLLRQEGGVRSTNDNVTKDGRTITCEWYNTNLVDDSGRVLGVASLAQDITERVALEERLRHSQKMEAVGRLAGGVAHDFNNLLTVILGYTQLLADSVPARSKMADSTAQIKSAAERAAGITRQLLAFSRKTVLTPRVLNLNDVLLNLDSLLRRLIGEDIEVFTVPADDLGSVKADPGQIEQVIMNLALNSRDAMPRGGKITLETANATLDQTYATDHQPVQPGRYIMLAVSDTGCGMSPETQSRIFEPFYTTKEVGKGTGLGLSMVYGIVKQSGGYIWVYSEPDRGTTFKIYLPRVDQPADSSTDEKRARPVQRGSETILLVEDDPQLRQLSSTVLAHCGYNMLVAATPEEGLDICKANHNDIRLLVTDVVMPRINGRELAEKILKVCPKVRVLYISGYTSNAIVHYGVLEEGLWFLPKPFSLSALVAKVREVLDSATPTPLSPGHD